MEAKSSTGKSLHDVDVQKFLDTVEPALCRVSALMPFGIERVVLDWGGIGDACHARAIAQQLGQYQKVAWITVPLVADLYRDDDMSVIAGFSSPWRDARQSWLADLGSTIQRIVFRVFAGMQVTDVSSGVLSYYNTWVRHITTYDSLFFESVGLHHDRSLRHTLRHYGSSPVGRYVCIENSSGTHGTMQADAYCGIVAELKRRGIDSYTVGGGIDVPIPGTISAIGFSLYDTFSIIKGGMAFIGRGSGNQSLVYSLRKMPLFEVEVPGWGSAGANGYHSVFAIDRRTLALNTEYIMKIIGDSNVS